MESYKAEPQELTPLTARTTKFRRRFDFSPVLVLIVLAACQALWFGPLLGKIGFYLDDWITFGYPTFARQDWNSLVAAAFNDARIYPRTLQGYYFPLTWLICGYSPFGHHLLNCIYEVIASWFFYLAIVRLRGTRSVAFMSALFLLLYPSHDCTHYWAEVNPIALSLVMYMASLWLAIKGAQQNRWPPLIIAYAVFLASLFNYESFAPLGLTTFLAILYVTYSPAAKRRTFTRACVLSAPFFLSIGLYLIHQKLLLHGMGFQHPIVFDPRHVLDVYAAAWNATLSPAAVEFFTYRAREGLAGPLSYLKPNLAALCTIAFSAMVWLRRKDVLALRWWILPAAGIATILASYSIYAITTDYMPVLNSGSNRINYGASVGVSLILAGVIDLIYRSVAGKAVFRNLLSATVFTLLIGFFTMANWGFSKPWTVSWYYQQSVIALVQARESQIQPGDCILLTNVPRFLFWSPVFDGRMDFESMVRVKKKTKKIDADVITNRTHIFKDCVIDQEKIWELGRFPYTAMFVLTPCAEGLIPVRSASELIEVIEKYNQVFGLPPKEIDRFKQESQTDAPLKLNTPT